MTKVISINGVSEDVKVSLKEDKRNLGRVRTLLFHQVMYEERDKVMLILVKIFGGLRYEDLEEVYSDGCMVLWNKLNDENFEFEGENMVGYLVKVCKNIGMHYLRKVRDDVVSWDEMIERKCVGNKDGLMEMFDVLADKEYEENEMYSRLDKVWEKLNDVEKMILKSYYWDGCRMEEIAHRVGYRNADSVKSKKSMVLKKMKELMKEEQDNGQANDGVIEVSPRETIRIAA